MPLETLLYVVVVVVVDEDDGMVVDSAGLRAQPGAGDLETVSAREFQRRRANATRRGVELGHAGGGGLAAPLSLVRTNWSGLSSGGQRRFRAVPKSNLILN